MPGDGYAGNLSGTLSSDFTVGTDQTEGARTDDAGELYLRSAVTGEYSLAQLIAGGIGLGYAVITTEGGLVYDTNGDIVIKVSP